MPRTSLLALTLSLSLLFMACGYDYVPTPRPHGYPRIDVPAQNSRSYDSFESGNCPFRFEYPDFGEVVRLEEDSCWVSIRYDRYDLTWHITHRNVPRSGKDKAAHFEDFRRLVYKHSKKSSRIEENLFQLDHGSGFLFEIYGEVGTPAQIFFSDPQEENLLIMSFYFQDATARDSLQPITQYMKEELNHALRTLRWE
jgi:gliding motility-associated lipoprotein GldD